MPTNPLKKKPKKKPQAVMVKRNHQNHQNRQNRISREDKTTLVADIEHYLKRFLVLDDLEYIAITAWVMAAWLSDLWDRFPHLAVTSAEMQSGKTRVLEVLELIAPNALLTPNMSLASIYRYIAETTPRPTLLLDEQHSLSQGQSKSEYGQAISALLNSSIRRKDSVMRCGSSEDGHKPTNFSNYCPKAFALIGDLNGITADRSLPIRMRRKTAADTVEKYRERTAEPEATKIYEALQEWADANGEPVQAVYDKAEEFDMRNDRMAELLTPLQAVLSVADKTRLPDLEKYAKRLDEKDAETLSPGIQLLLACRAIFTDEKTNEVKTPFMLTATLINTLAVRVEEPWGTYNPRSLNGQEITPRQLASLLKQYGIEPEHGNTPSTKKQRGYHAARFMDAWNRYLSLPGKCGSGGSAGSAGSKPSTR